MAVPSAFFAACSRAFAAAPWACPRCGQPTPPPWAAAGGCACGHGFSAAEARAALLQPLVAAGADPARFGDPEHLQAVLAGVGCSCGHCRDAVVMAGADGRRLCRECGCLSGDGDFCQVCGADLRVPRMRFVPGESVWRCEKCGGELTAPGDSPDFPVAVAYPLLLLSALAARDTDVFSGDDWAAAATLRPEVCRDFAETIVLKASAANWRWLSRVDPDWRREMAARPEFADLFKARSPASARELAIVLAKRPDLLPLADLSLLDGQAWMGLLAADWGAFHADCDWRKVAAAEGGDFWRPLRHAACREAAGPRLAPLAADMPGDGAFRFLLAFPEMVGQVPPAAIGRLDGEQWRRWLKRNPRLVGEIPWAAIAPATLRQLWRDCRAVRPVLRQRYRETLEGRGTPAEVVAMVEALPGIVAARHAKCLQGLSAAQWARVVNAAPRLGRHCPKGLLPGLLRHSPEAAGPLGETVLGAIDAGEWFALLKDRPSLGPLCPYAFAKLTDAQLEELAKPGSPAEVRGPARRCRFSRKLGRFLVAAFALALAAGAALWLLDYIFTGMTNDTIDTVAIVCGVIVGVTLFGLIVKKVDISGRDIRFIISVLIMIGWGVWWLIKFVLTTVRDWFN